MSLGGSGVKIVRVEKNLCMTSVTPTGPTQGVETHDFNDHAACNRFSDPIYISGIDFSKLLSTHLNWMRFIIVEGEQFQERCVLLKGGLRLT